MKDETQKKYNDHKMAVRSARFNKDRYWRASEVNKSLLISKLGELSEKGENDISKVDLFSLINLMFGYMRALNLYRYYRDDLTNLLAHPVSEDED